jgi:hypothetical protein
MIQVEALVVAVAVLASGCGASPEGDSATGATAAGGPRMALVDSLPIQEPESLPVGRFVQLATAPDGGVYLSDHGAGRVLEFDRSGQLRRVLGKKGKGPGEFEGAGMPVIRLRDSTLLVMDPVLRRLSVFEARSGEFLRSMPTPFQDVGQIWTEAPDGSLFFALVASTNVVGQLARNQDAFVALGGLPPQVSSTDLVFLMYGRPEVVPDEGRFLAQFPTFPGIQILDSAGQFAGMVDLPTRLRRGTPPDLVEQHMQAFAANGPFQYLGSLAGSLQRLSDGSLAVLNVDLDLPPRERGQPPPDPTNVRYYMSVLSTDDEQACVDGTLPFTSDAVMPVPSFAGDTLLALSRRVVGETELRTVLYRYLIDTTGCQWVPTGGVRAPLPGTRQ